LVVRRYLTRTPFSVATHTWPVNWEKPACPNLVERTNLETLYTDGGYGGNAVDLLLEKNQVQMLQTGIRGGALDPNQLHMADFNFECSETGQPLRVTCPHGQKVNVELGQKKKGLWPDFQYLSARLAHISRPSSVPRVCANGFPFTGCTSWTTSFE
jgi:hypothetical protein